MKRILDSKPTSIAAFAFSLTYLCLTFKMRSEWWMFADVFFLFMATFAHMIALLLGRFNPFIRKKLELSAVVLGILFLISLIAECVVFES